MVESMKPVARISELALETFEHGAAYQCADAVLGARLGLTALGACYTEVPPGKSACPFHVHHAEDEMFVILEGHGTYRFGDASYAIQAGDVLGAPRGGPRYAHKLTNTGEGALRYLVISSKADTDVCEYPDSGKFQVSSQRSSQPGDRLRFAGYAGDGVDYWEGEDDSA